MQWLKSPWIAVALTIVSFLLGVGDVPFNDAATFVAWLQAHGVQVGSFGAIGYLAWLIVSRARDYIDADVIKRALESGKAHIADLVKGVEATGDESAVRRLKTVAADAAWTTLYHGCDNDPEVTEALNKAHALYRSKRVTIPTTATPAPLKRAA